MKQFDAAFKAATENRYPYIRFVRAEYGKSEKRLIIFFIADAAAVDGGVLSDTVKSDIVKVLAGFLPDEITFQVRYVKVFADEETVRVKLMQALSKHLTMAVGAISAEDINITVNDYIIDIGIKTPKHVFSLFANEKIKESILNELGESFVEKINLELIEKYISEADKAKIVEKNKEIYNKANENSQITVDAEGRLIDTSDGVFDDLTVDASEDTIVVYEQIRQIKAVPVCTLAGKSYLTSMPMYICDIKDNFESAVICGSIQGLQRREYKNKNYGAEVTSKRFKKNTSDEKLPLYSFTIDDTTGRFSVVYFPFDNNNSALEKSLREGADVVVSGKIGERNGVLQLTVDKMWLADVDYGTVKNELPAKKEPKNYGKITPEKYFEPSQCNLGELLNGEEETPPFLKGKTFVVFDFETTGLDVASCMVVQIGSYKIVDGKIVESFNTLVNPMCHIPEDASKIHGVYDKDVMFEPEFMEILPDFYKFTRGATLVGHNVFGYDLPILMRMSKPYGYVFDNPVLDTLVLAKSQSLSVSRYNLETLSKHFNINLDNAHSADCDAIATAKLFLILASRLK